MKKIKKTIKLSPEAIEALKRHKEFFIKKFGREPGPNDLVFFDPDSDSDVPQSVDPNKMRQEFIEAFTKAGLKHKLPEFLRRWDNDELLFG